jgi:pseudouridine-5'-phosphate glycosidase/pseudouridine kinase
MSVSGIETLPSPSRTAQYIAVNNANKDLALAMADMSILETIPDDTIQELASTLFSDADVSENYPKVFVADANWSSTALHTLLTAAHSSKTTTTIFEPVSTAKALRIFQNGTPSSISSPSPSPSVFPAPLAHIITPNHHELTALHDFALQRSFFELPEWFEVIDALGIPSTGLRVPLAVEMGSELVDEGVPQMAIKLLPWFPCVLTKLGPKGVLMVKLLSTDASELSEEAERKFVLARNMSTMSKGDAEGTDIRSKIGGLYIRLFPVEQILKPEEIVSVNGIGDTFCGALASQLASGKRVQDIVLFAQRAASLSLRSREAVNPALRELVGSGEEVEVEGEEMEVDEMEGRGWIRSAGGSAGWTGERGMGR